MLLGAETMLLAVRWQEIASVCHATLAFNSALQITFIATFFNQVLPSTVGGDGARIWLFARKGAGWAKATYSVLVDRVVGLVGQAFPKAMDLSFRSSSARSFVVGVVGGSSGS